ncbi:phosphonate ABC transporter substrate-binding protein [Aliihoeflea aestuarii]|jgi:phosphate transport system substrate-binding protein|uniref:substrate-binding domain-containing protein n=1 Tax=Aliihoeflea aestuarii TaxID=453840 RepID=UPI0020951BAE|nr:substrate-binding domain-containing protein [Aliihoeflea aestuarii]MCO6392664.1 phosphonate ABC transporter substrate-binding protein [Aliihoeflea aestuarii]
MKKFVFAASAAAIAIAASAGAATAQSRDTIQIAGSSTVLPFASIVAEEFGNAFPEFNAPVVGSGGSGGGLRQFCQGTGDNTIDIANSSRRIQAGEIEACNGAGVNEILEVQFGYDGIVFAVSADKEDFALEPVHVFKAIAAQVPVDGEMVANPYTTWNEIDDSLPNQPISMAIPASNHGTREVFEERVLVEGCEAAELPEMEEEAMEAACTALRQDVVIEIAGDYTETLARLQSNADTVGVFGLSFYDQNRDTLKVATISGIEPSLETIAAGEYPVSRPLFFYVKGEHIGVVPGLEEYVSFFLSDQMAGEGGALEGAGLIPAPAEETADVQAKFDAREAITADQL